MDLKRCFKCLEEKPIDEFYHHSSMKDGHLNKCKSCAKTDARLRRIECPEKVRASDMKKMASLPRSVSAERARRARAKSPGSNAAHLAVQRALKRGNIVRPSGCEVCGAEVRLHSHHFDYSQKLDVIWVCPKCHRDIHTASRQEAF